MAVCLLLATAGPAAAVAQSRDGLDSRGREFWLAFLPTNGDSPAPTYKITIWSAQPTSGTITYLDEPASSFDVSINQPYWPHTYDLDTNRLMLDNPRMREISSRTLHLKFDHEVTLYAINTMRWSSDAMTALPVDALGREYFILSYPNTQAPSPLGDRAGASDFPSQFGIIAAEDGTRVDIEPTARLNGRDASRFSVNLNAGEVFLAQADGRAGIDLTGTKITSDRPVVVYGSHQRTNIPYQYSVGRDHLIEQLLPVEHWSNRAMLTPHFQIPKTTEDQDFARVIAAFDDTEIRLDSLFLGTIDAGQRLEIPLSKDAGRLLTANRPIMAAQYHNSSVESEHMQPNDSIGDPFFMLLASREQFDSCYVFQSYGTKDFRRHFINVVIPQERIGTLRLDGARVTEQFIRIPKTSYSYAQIELPDGGHVIKASVPFGLYVYGYGPYNSYGYPGGFVLDTLFKDHKEPLIAVYDSCLGGTGKAYDDSTHDFGMERVELLAGSTNVTLDAERPGRGSDSIHFRLNLIDPYRDGYAQLKAVDTAGLEASTAVWLRGFTVALMEGQSGPITLDTLASLSGFQFCRRIPIVNYGRFDQVVESISISPQSDSVELRTALPMLIPPGGRADIEICFRYTGDTSFAVEISIGNSCIQRSVARLPLISGIDSLPPSIVPGSGICDPQITLRLADPGLMNSGIARVQYIVQENYVPVISPALPAKSVTLVLNRQDPRRDLIYDIVVTDAVGLTRRVSDTVGGFTLAAYQAPWRQVAIRLHSPFEYHALQLGERSCDTVYLENYGLLPLDVVNPRMLGNTEFSIPPEQLPLRLLPGERRGLAVCALPRTAGLNRDTFAVDFVCGGVSETVEMAVDVRSFDLGSRDRCGNPLVFSVNSAARRTFLAPPMPNPSSGRSTLTFGVASLERVTLGIYDLNGIEWQRLLDDREFPPGLARIEAGLADFPAGVYLLRMTTGDGAVYSQKLVVHR